MGINYLTGSTSGTNFAINGFSNTPSTSWLLTQDLIMGYDLGTKASNRFPFAGTDANTLYTGFGLYVDRKDGTYYWYLASKYLVDYCIYFTIEFYTFGGEKKTPASAPWITVFDGNTYLGKYSITDGDCTINLEDLSESSFYLYGNNYSGSLGFWLCSCSFDTWECFMEGTKVLMADNSLKNIEDVLPHDLVKYISDAGEEKITEVLLPTTEYAGFTNEYIIYTFSDGSTLNIYGKQKLWNNNINDYSDIQTWELGTTTKKFDGTIVTLTKKETVCLEEPKKHYFLQTWNGNYTVDGFRTYTSQDTIWKNLSREENKQYWKSEEEMKKQKRKVLTRRYKGTPTNFTAFKRSMFDSNTSEKIKASEISKDKKYLNDTDYVAIKHADSAISDEEYLPIQTKRIQARKDINDNETKLAAVRAEREAIALKYKAKTERPRDSSQGGESLVLMADGSVKAMKDIVAGDTICYLDDDFNVVTTQVMLPVEPELVWDYTKLTLENGDSLRMSGKRRIYNVSKNRYCHQKDCRIGEKLLLNDGTEVAIANIENIELDDPEEFYRLNTRSGRYILGGVSLCGDLKRNYDEMMYEEHEYWRPSEEFMAEWKAEIGE